MRMSKYSIAVDGYPSPEESLLFNTRTHALVKVSSRMRQTLEDLPSMTYEEVKEKEDGLLPLYRMGIIVADEKDDDERFEKFIDRRKYGIDTKDFTVSILTTYSCNFACTYCFEETTRESGQKMDRQTADIVMRWIQKRLMRYGIKQCTVNYYGGEPLLNQPIMEYISSRMHAWCAENGLTFKVYIQTNGALLTGEFIDRHKAWGLEGARVSLDGVKEVHDRQRPMRGTGEGTFDRVLQNVAAAADKIRISIAAGYDNNDPRGIIDLLDDLDRRGVLRKLDQFLFNPVHPTLGPKGHAEKIQNPGCVSNYETENLLKTNAVIRAELERRGMETGKSGLSTSMCPLTREEGTPTIDTNGLIFKCTAMLGHPELAVGDVRSDAYNQKQKEFLSMEAFRQCDDDCPYKPLCNTGCRLFGMFKHGDFAAKSCERGYMERFVPDAVKKEYELRTAARKAAAQPA